jgi:signal peptidase I
MVFGSKPPAKSTHVPVYKTHKGYDKELTHKEIKTLHKNGVDLTFSWTGEYIRDIPEKGDTIVVEDFTGKPRDIPLTWGTYHPGDKQIVYSRARRR